MQTAKNVESTDNPLLIKQYQIFKNLTESDEMIYNNLIKGIRVIIEGEIKETGYLTESNDHVISVMSDIRIEEVKDTIYYLFNAETMEMLSPIYSFLMEKQINSPRFFDKNLIDEICKTELNPYLKMQTSNSDNMQKKPASDEVEKVKQKLWNANI